MSSVKVQVEFSMQTLDAYFHMYKNPLKIVRKLWFTLSQGYGIYNNFQKIGHCEWRGKKRNCTPWSINTSLEHHLYDINGFATTGVWSFIQDNC